MRTPAGFALDAWPEVEGGEALQIPHDGNLSPTVLEALSDRGYAPVDVRFLDGEAAIKLTLRGARMGTIKLSADKLKALELAAKIEGMIGPARPKSKKTKGLLDGLDTLQMLEGIRGAKQTMQDERKRPGRPSGKHDETPRLRTVNRKREVINE